MSEKTSDQTRRKIRVVDFPKMKRDGHKIVMVTSYDYPTAMLADQAGVDSILVGDSYGMVVLGYDNTIPVTMDEMIPVARAVKRGASHPLLIGDMPFLTFQVSKEEAVRNAGRFIQDGGMEAVKIEGGEEMAPTVKAIVTAGIPVLGHIGVTPQTATLHGGYVVQGRTADAGEKIGRDAKALEEAGVFGIVLEMVTEEAAKLVTENVSVPTIGIGSGRYCDGQVLVLHDILGLYPKFVPKFAKRYADLATNVKDALTRYTDEVRSGAFPEPQHVFRMDDDQRARLVARRKS